MKSIVQVVSENKNNAQIYIFLAQVWPPQLQGRHMSFSASQIVSHSILFYLVIKRNTNGPHYWPFVKGIHH